MNQRRPFHAGFTLIEVLVIITIGGVALAMAALIVRGMLLADAASRTHAQTTLSLGRLAEQFRADARGSNTATPAAGEKPTACTLAFPDGRRIRYECLDGRIVRHEENADAAAANEFALPPGVAAGIAWDADARRLSLLLKSDKGTEGDGWPLRITARVAADKRVIPAAKEQP